MTAPELDSDNRSKRIQNLIELLLAGGSESQGQSDDEFLQQHADLMPELGEQLRRLRRLQAARQQAQGPTEHVERIGAAAKEWGLRVRCPTCGQSIEVVSQTPLNAISCNSCGSNFNLVTDDAETKGSISKKVFGHFELIERIGMGAFGSVWKARDTELDRLVAVKIPRFVAIDPFEMEKFVREARSAAQLRHPHIVTVHEIGREEDTLYIISELIDGMPLSEWSCAKHSTHRDAASMCRTIAQAIHYAHQTGVVHRDLKPANILIDAGGAPHITDFGLAKRESGEITLTLDGELIGTPAYLSPEQARGEAHSCDRRSDVYSLGAILFELLTGELPFRGTVRMLLLQVIHEDPPSPRKLDGTVSRDLETICLKCLEKDPDRRYQSAQELAEDLGRWLDHRPIQAKPASAVAKIQKWCHRNPLTTSAICLMMTLCVAGALYWQTRPAYLDLQVSPTNASASLDREGIVLSEGRAFVATGPGGFQLTVTAPGYVAQIHQVQLIRGRDYALPVTISLDTEFGFAVVESRPSGGRVKLVNDQGTIVGEGVTPFHSPRLPSGTYKVALSKELYRSVDLKINVPTGERVSRTKTIQLVTAVDGAVGSWLISKFRKALTKEVEISFRGKSLTEVIDEIRTQTGLQIKFKSSETDRLDAAKVFFQSRITLDQIKNGLRICELTMVPCCENNTEFALNVVTIEEAETGYARVLHPIGDLIDAENDPNADLIIRSVINVSPASWNRVGRKGSISFVRSVNALDIHQVWDIQYDIDGHLTELRRSKIEAGRTAPISQDRAVHLLRMPEFKAILRTLSRVAYKQSVEGTLKACIVMAKAPDVSESPVLDQIAEAVMASSDRLVSADHKEMLSEAALNIGFCCLARGRFDCSTKLAMVAHNAAKEIHRADLIYQAELLKGQVPRVKRMCETLDGFHSNFFLASSKVVPSSSLARFLCFIQGSWRRGLPMLVESADSELKSVAEMELAAPADPTAQLAVADLWWKLSDSQADSDLASSYRQRAKHWYLTALNSTDSGNRDEVSKRVRPRVASLPQRPLILRIRTRGIENKQTIRISNEGISMTSSHGTRSIQINHLLSENLRPSLVHLNTNSIGSQVFLSAVDFTAADVRPLLQKHEAHITYEVGPDHVHLEFQREPEGTGDFEVIVTTGSRGFGATTADQL